MKGKQIFTLMEDIDPSLVEDAMPASWKADIGKPPKRRHHPFRAVAHFMNTGWAAAILSVVVSLAVLTGVVVAGRMAPEPSGPASSLPGESDEGGFRDETTSVYPCTETEPDQIGSSAVTDFLTHAFNFNLIFNYPEEHPAVLFTDRNYTLTGVYGYLTTAEGRKGIGYEAPSFPTEAEEIRARLESGYLHSLVVLPNQMMDSAELEIYFPGPSNILEEAEVTFRAYYTDYTPVDGHKYLITDLPLLCNAALTAGRERQFLVMMEVRLYELECIELADTHLKEVIVEIPFLLKLAESGSTPTEPIPESTHISLSQQGGTTMYLDTPYMLWQSGITTGPDGESLNYDASGPGAISILPELAASLMQNPYIPIASPDTPILIHLARPNSVITRITGIDAETMQEIFSMDALVPVTSASVSPKEVLVNDRSAAFYLVITVNFGDGETSGEYEYPVYVMAPSIETVTIPEEET